MKQTKVLVLSMSQAKNYVKRTRGYSHQDDCGCCFGGYEYKIDEESRNVLKVESGQHRGEFYISAEVVARIRR